MSRSPKPSKATMVVCTRAEIQFESKSSVELKCSSFDVLWSIEAKHMRILFEDNCSKHARGMLIKMGLNLFQPIQAEHHTRNSERLSLI